MERKIALTFSIILDLQKYMVKNYSEPSSTLMGIQRLKGLDIIREYKCTCGTPLAYTCFNGLPNIKEAINNTNTKGMDEQEKVLFYYSDGLVIDSKNSLVFEELAKHKFS